MPNQLLQFNNIGYKRNNKIILKEINFIINKGEFAFLMGLNGSGKSTICKLITGYIKPSSGTIIKNPKIKITYIPQLNHNNLVLPIKVLDLIKLNNKNFNLNIHNKLIEEINVSHLLQKDIKNLSGGEMQKVFLVRALSINADLIIMDEPLSAIDFKTKTSLYNIIQKYTQLSNTACLMISHDINFVYTIASKVICISNGTICCKGQTEEISDELKKIFSDNWKFYKHRNH